MIIFLDFFRKSFYAEYFSMAFILSFLLNLMALLLPLFACNATLYFWKSPWYYYDKPIVEFTPYYQAYINIYNNSNYNTYFTSSFSDLNNLYPTNYTLEHVIVENSYTIDKRLDDNSILNYVFTFKLPNGDQCSSIRNVKLLLFFKYGFDSKTRFIMNSLGMIDVDTVGGFTQLTTKGFLRFKQTSPIPYSKIPINNLYYNKNELGYLGLNNDEDHSPYDILEIFKYHQNNNYSTYYDYKYFITPSSLNQGSTCRIKVDVIIPEQQKVIYIPSFSDLIRNAWSQYFFVFIIIFIIIRYIMEFLMEHKLCCCYETGELINF